MTNVGINVQHIIRFAVNTGAGEEIDTARVTGTVGAFTEAVLSPTQLLRVESLLYRLKPPVEFGGRLGGVRGDGEG